MAGPLINITGFIATNCRQSLLMFVHTYCTNMALSGISAKTLQYLMGHSDISITLNVYTHIKFDNAQKEVELVQQRQQKEMENVRKELEQVGAIRPKIIPFKNEA